MRAIERLLPFHSRLRPSFRIVGLLSPEADSIADVVLAVAVIAPADFIYRFRPLHDAPHMHRALALDALSQSGN